MTLRAMYVAPLVAIGAVFAATGFADQLMTSYSEPPVSQSTMAPSDPGTPIPAAEDASANPDAIQASTEPVIARADTSSTTTIYGERRTEDQFITDDVVKAIAAEPRISGKVGVETFRRVVTLTGRVTTQGQVDRLTLAAHRAVDRDVEIRNYVMSKV